MPRACDPPCPERARALADGAFAYSRRFGWTFTERSGHPVRHMSDATWYAVYIGRHDRAHENHTGEPWRYATCPWCDGDLLPPGVMLDELREAQGEEDGC